MAELSVPRTPSPNPSSSASKAVMATEQQARDLVHSSPPPASQPAGELTPPPSSQVRKTKAKSPQPANMPHLLASPPTTLKAAPPLRTSGLFGEIPTIDSVQNLNEDELRTLLSEVLPALTEARMTAAHVTLQHNLLTIENNEYIKRAEVEQEMTRREVEILQEGQADRGGVSASPRSPQSTARRHLDLALKRCNELQIQNVAYAERLGKAKKCIKRLDGDNFELKNEIKLLRDRIRDNRAHLNAMRSSGAISINGSPLPDYHTPLHRTPRTPGTARSTLSVNPVGSQDAFNALLQAGEVMSGEANSVPSTPTRNQIKKSHHSHMRGAHSMSSIPTTPNRSRPATAGKPFVTPLEQTARTPRLAVPTPSAQLTYEEDRRCSSRDSTISASESENEAYDVDEVPASQASQQATSMLRRETVSAAARKTAKSPVLTQAKLYGQVKKAGVDKSKTQHKRPADSALYVEGKRSAKKAKLGHSPHSRVGLGIEDWTSSAKS